MRNRYVAWVFVAALVATYLWTPLAHAQVRIYGTNAAGQSVPIQVAADGTLKLTLAVSGYEFLGTSFNTTLAATDPTAARTITLPDLTGTVALLGGGQTFTAPFYVANGATAAGSIYFYENSANGTNTARLIGPAATADVVVTLPAVTGTLALTADKLSAFAATTSAELAGVLSDETGTGLVVLDTAPAFASTVRIGAAATYDGIVISPAVKGAGQFDLTISTADLTAARAINFPNADGTVALTANTLAAFAATTSAEFAGVISNETGTGLVVLDTAPSFSTTGRFGAASTYDGIIVSPAVKGVGQFDLTLSTADLTAARTINYPDAAGLVALSGATDPRVTAGSGTGVTVDEVAATRRVVYKVTVASTQFISAAVTHDITIATLPAKTRLVGVYGDLTQTFACTAVCTTATLSMTVGTAAGGNQILASFDADAATAVFGDVDVELGASVNAAGRVQDAYIASWSATQVITARLTSGTGNLGDGAATNLSQGSVTFYLITEILP